MGQRFQIVENQEGRIRIYHSQWLWGDYAIRRIGTAIRNYLSAEEIHRRKFEEYLKGSFYGKPKDMNSVGRYYGEEALDDNEVSCINYVDENPVKVDKISFRKVLSTLDNNDGWCYVEFDKDNKLKGYCFLARTCGRKPLRVLISKPLSAEQYMKHYTRTEGFNKMQEREYQKGLVTFSKLKVIKPLTTVRRIE